MLRRLVRSLPAGVGWLCHDQRGTLVVNRPRRSLWRGLSWSLISVAFWALLGSWLLARVSAQDRQPSPPDTPQMVLLLVFAVALVLGSYLRLLVPTETRIPRPGCSERTRP
jgi:uncharacterized membrane protein HdeD (DUF308 family)